MYAPTSDRSLNATIRNCDFKNNEAQDGGAIFLSGNIDLLLDSSNFSSNYADYNGGAICCLANATIIFQSSSFDQNSAGNDNLFFYNDPENKCEVICSPPEFDSDPCSPSLFYPTKEISLVLVCTTAACAFLMLLLFDGFCIYWIRQTRSLSSSSMMDSYVDETS